jgi:hypothetical protein
VIRAVWPEVPCLILIRSPVEIIVSNIREPTKWLLDGYDTTASLFGPPPPGVVKGSFADSIAWRAGEFCSRALATADAHCKILDYADFGPDVIANVLEYFNLPASAETRRSLDELMRFNSKYQNRVFEDDSVGKRRAATDAIKMSAATWADGPYERLRRWSIQ